MQNREQFNRVLDTRFGTHSAKQAQRDNSPGLFQSQYQNTDSCFLLSHIFLVAVEAQVIIGLIPITSLTDRPRKLDSDH